MYQIPELQFTIADLPCEWKPYLLDPDISCVTTGVIAFKINLAADTVKNPVYAIPEYVAIIINLG